MSARHQLLALAAVAGAVLGVAPAASAEIAATAPALPSLAWKPCGEAANVSCSTFEVPRDYERPRVASLRLFVAKSPATDPAHRIGSLFVNPGGPGSSIAAALEANGAGLFAALNARFDIIAMDPRGAGQSAPAIDCHADQERDGIYSQPFMTPKSLDIFSLAAKDASYVHRCLRLNPELRYVSTENVARDMDLVRQALHEQQITYVGFSYGTVLGATYASLFPKSYRAMVLDGPVDADAYFNDPMSELSAQSSGFESSLDRFLAACASDQGACSGFGGGDPQATYDRLLARLDRAPLATPDGRAVDGDDARAGTLIALYSKSNWPFLGQALADLERGDGANMRFAADLYYARNDDGTYQPGPDAYFAITAIEQRYPHDLGTYLRAGRRSFEEHPHFWWNNGYLELNYGIFPVRGDSVFSGPFRVPRSSPAPLVVATTHDPATPYRGAQNLVRELANARLLTMDGDGHTAYGANSACIDRTVESYVADGTLPPSGTVCQQDVGFSAARSKSAPLVGGPAIGAIGPHARPTAALP
ncbi:MAG: hypothetical protein QOD83_4158 [Solirubrobacteraceae bacterium]|jgi:pimeloyl-ACP methyl ester carboxylesterase|nr:hypothetical protein [Solirubrobacteraceae bacterium]